MTRPVIIDEGVVRTMPSVSLTRSCLPATPLVTNPPEVLDVSHPRLAGTKRLAFQLPGLGQDPQVGGWPREVAVTPEAAVSQALSDNTWAMAGYRLPHVASLLSLWLVCGTPMAHGLDNGLGQTPILAYSTWNYFNNAVNETLVRQLADALVSTGLRDLGFASLNIDAGYLVPERDSKGALQVNLTKFPRGMRALSSYLGSRGIGLGVYTDISNHSCGFGPGSFGHYEQDAATIAIDWNASYLKVDECHGGDGANPPPPRRPQPHTPIHMQVLPCTCPFPSHDLAKDRLLVTPQ